MVKLKGNTMKKISAIVNLMFVLLLVSSLTFAQYNNDSSKTHEGTNQNKEKDNDLLGSKEDDPFRQTALTLAQDLQSRLTLSNDQVDKITDILVDYKDDIADIKKDMASDYNNNDHNAVTDKTGTKGTGTTKTESDRPGVAKNDSTDNNMLGGKTDYSEKFRDADVSANDDIEGVLEEGQLAKYVQIKRDWWDTVKERAHSAASSKNHMENSEDNDSDNDNDNN